MVVSVDPLAQATLEALEHLLGEWVALDSWDDPPGLLLIVRMNGPTTLVQGLVPFQLPPLIWTLRPTWEVLDVLTRAVRTVGVPVDYPANATVVGLALVCEGWGLSSIGHTPAQIEATRKWAEQHSIADHPDRIENKMILAVDTAGFRYMVQHGRGEPEPEKAMVDTRDSPTNKLEGRLHDGLAELLEAIGDAGA